MSNDDVIVDEIRAALEQDPRLPHPAEVAYQSKRAQSPCEAPSPARVCSSGGSDRQDGARGT